jgi:hypothetical protein
MNWIKDFFKSTEPEYIDLDESKNSLRDLIEILKTRELGIGEGNRVVLTILDVLVRERDEK